MSLREASIVSKNTPATNLKQRTSLVPLKIQPILSPYFFEVSMSLFRSNAHRRQTFFAFFFCLLSFSFAPVTHRCLHSRFYLAFDVHTCYRTSAYIFTIPRSTRAYFLSIIRCSTSSHCCSTIFARSSISVSLLAFCDACARSSAFNFFLWFFKRVPCDT